MRRPLEAQARMAQAIGRLDGMFAGPGADGGDQEIFLEEAETTLSLRVSTDPQTGEPSSRLLYIDADGTYISGLSNQPVETLFAPEPQPESALPGWLSTLADLDADYDVLTRLGGTMQVAGGAADLAVAVPLLLAPEPTMLTKVAAGAVGLRGFDDVQAGLRTAISGEATDTVTQTVATDAALAMGADPDSAKNIGLAVDVLTGLLNPAGRLRHVTTSMAEELAQEAAEQAGRHADETAKALGATEDLAEQGARRADDAAGLTRKIPTPDEVRGGSPITIPDEATVTVETKAAGYDQIRFRWDDGSARYDARWHTRTPGAPAEQGDTWVVERKTHGTPTGQQKALHILLADGRWVSKQSWQEAIAARQAGTATAAQEAMLAAGHHPAN